MISTLHSNTLSPGARYIVYSSSGPNQSKGLELLPKS